MSERKKPRRLTPAEWAEACALWESGEVTLAVLEEKFGIAKETFSRRFTKEGIVKGAAASEHAKAVAEQVKKASKEDATVLATRIRETKENHYEWISALERLAMHEVVSATKAGIPVASKHENLKAIKRAMEIVALGRVEKYVLLGLDKDEVDQSELPELLIAEMTADEIVQARSNTADPLMAISDLSDIEDPEDEGVVEEGFEEELGVE